VAAGETVPQEIAVSTPDEDLVAFAKVRLGTVLKGKYRLDDVVGYGGMAVVFRATHRNQAELAVKVLHPKLARVNGVRQRFLREGYAANSVKHKGAVLVLDDDVDDDGSTFLVMELLHGQSCELIWQRRGGTFPLRSALTVAHEALDVLASAHTRGIVHRDIKPANLFVTKDGVLKVLDFGIAKVLDAVSAQSTGRLPIGTPAFMSPEQALGESNVVGPKTDVWAMGATLFSLLSGELVHDAPTAHEILVKTATEKPRSLASVVPFLAKDVIELVDRALEVDPQARWSSAAEMRDVAARVHRAIFREPPSTSSFAELYGGDNIDTQNANDETVKERVPPRMSTPPPASQGESIRPSKHSSGKMRVSPWTDEKKTAPRLSLVLDESGVPQPKPATPARPVILPPTSSRPSGGLVTPTSQGMPVSTPGGIDPRTPPSNKTVRLAPPSSPSPGGGLSSSSGPPRGPLQGPPPPTWTEPSPTVRIARPRDSRGAVAAVVLAVLFVICAGATAVYVAKHRATGTMPTERGKR
jgi:serine/threonine-protein kinase